MRAILATKLGKNLVTNLVTHAIAIPNRQRLAITTSESQASPAEIAIKSQCRNHKNRIAPEKIAAIRNHTLVVATISGGFLTCIYM